MNLKQIESTPQSISHSLDTHLSVNDRCLPSFLCLECSTPSFHSSNPSTYYILPLLLNVRLCVDRYVDSCLYQASLMKKAFFFSRESFSIYFFVKYQNYAFVLEINNNIKSHNIK